MVEKSQYYRIATNNKDLGVYDMYNIKQLRKLLSEFNNEPTITEITIKKLDV